MFVFVVEMTFVSFCFSLGLESYWWSRTQRQVLVAPPTWHGSAVSYCKLLWLSSRWCQSEVDDCFKV